MLPACVSRRRLIELHQEIKSDILSGDIKWAFYCWMNGAVEDEDVEIERAFLLACGNTRRGDVADNQRGAEDENKAEAGRHAGSRIITAGFFHVA